MESLETSTIHQADGGREEWAESQQGSGAAGNVSEIDRPIAIDGLATAALGGPDCIVVNCIAPIALMDKPPLEKRLLPTHTKKSKSIERKRKWTEKRPDECRPITDSRHKAEGNTVFSSLPASMAKLPMRMEFPKFGESRGSADVTDFIERCENFE
ncbi:hypothetical protein EYF80_021460 [Liparis tanakae]|uniref:Uncharacterized protein n=1 Tax=Liparis tanakae TaxID=230148 RepID=A0A4Z2HRE4_9TELE|nr:hypothetical protein EYF80_021460 [Liparis tanakae]